MPSKKKITLYTEADLMKLSVSELLDLYQNSIEVIKNIESIIKPIAKTPAPNARPISNNVSAVDPSGLFPVYQTNSTQEAESLNVSKGTSATKPTDSKINMGNEVVEFIDVSDPSYMEKSFNKKGNSTLNTVGTAPTFSQNKKTESSSGLETPPMETIEDVKLRKSKRATQSTTVDSDTEAE